MSSTDSFGYWLRRRRKARDLTQRQLAEHVGCTQATVRKLEADERRPSEQLAVRLAEALAVPDAEQAAFLRAARGMGRVDRLDLMAAPIEPAPQLGAATFPHILPAPPNALIGRAAEAAAVWALLLRPATRLVSLTGPGGTGKTRLALQVASELLDQFPDGVCFVDLAAVSDPAMLLPTVATALGLRQQAGVSAHERLVAFLRGRRLLLLDNFEQILDAGPQLAALLAALPELRLLVTSRFVLRLQAEQEFPVTPLGLPTHADEDDLERLAQAKAVQLFVARAHAARHELALGHIQLRAVAAICRALDGLPLAIELAAAWVRLFTPEAILGRLDHRLGLLVGGPRDLPARQRTLRATIDWSYRLLEPAEQAFFCRMGVFSGGWSLEAAEAFATEMAAERPANELLAALVERQLVQVREGLEGEPCFSLLETLREYALERLEAQGELEQLRRRHAELFAVLAERAEPHLHSLAARRWMDRLEADWDNLRAGLLWSTQTPGGAPLGLALAGAIWWFWELRGRRREGREWLIELLAHPGAAAPTQERARALFGAAYLLDNDFELAMGDRLLDELEQLGMQLGDLRIKALVYLERGGGPRTHRDPDPETTLLEQSLALFQQLGDQQGTTMALFKLAAVHLEARSEPYFQNCLTHARAAGDLHLTARTLQALGLSAMSQGDLTRAEPYLRESLAIAEAQGDQRTTVQSLSALGNLALAHGDLTAAMAAYQNSLALARRLGETASISGALGNLIIIAHWQADLATGLSYLREVYASPIAQVRPVQEAWIMRMEGIFAEQQGDFVRAEQLFSGALQRYRAADEKPGIALALCSLGHLWARAGELERAEAAFRESIARYHAIEYFGVATCLVGLAALAEQCGNHLRAARLWGAAGAMGAGSRPDWTDCRPDDALRVEAARVRLSAPELAAAWAAGSALTIAEAVAEALGEGG